MRRKPEAPLAIRRGMLWFVALGLVAAACTGSTSQPNEEVPATTTTEPGGSPVDSAEPVEPLLNDDFAMFVADVGGTLLRRTPEEVTDLGLSGLLSQRNDKLNNLSRQYRLETRDIAASAAARLATLDVAALASDDQITAAILAWYLDDIITMANYLDHVYAVNYITGAHANFPEFMADVHQIAGVPDADAYVERLRGSSAQLGQVVANLERSESRGLLPTDTGIQIAAWQINNQLSSPQSHPLVADLEERLLAIDSVTDVERDRLVGAARAAVQSEVLPAYRNLLNAVNGAETRSDAVPGVASLPAGDDYYAAILAHHLSIDMTPDEVHAIGLEHVARLTGEITNALTDLGYNVETLGFAEAVTQARRDGGSFPLGNEEQRADVLTAAESDIAASASLFAAMFTTFPESDLIVRRPRPGREGGTGAYYRPPPAFGDRPGQYYLSLGGSEMPGQTFRTTNFHEAVPGHHFQLALQRESRDLPLIQRAAIFTGFAEGWALYAERLAFEAGAYADDPQGNIGRLRMELLRASRVVVDTGIHHLGWSYDQALDYMVELGFDANHASSEIDRYVVWPGQAPAYLIGMVEILRLRDHAQTELGDAFDLSAFHDEVLRHGSVPLGVLDDVVAQYIAANG